MNRYQRIYRAWRTAYWLRSIGEREHLGKPAAIAFMRALQSEKGNIPVEMRVRVKANFINSRNPKPERYCAFHNSIAPVLHWLLADDRKSIKRRRARIAAYSIAVRAAYPRIKLMDWRTAPEGRLFIRE